MGSSPGRDLEASLHTHHYPRGCPASWGCTGTGFPPAWPTEWQRVVPLRPRGSVPASGSGLQSWGRKRAGSRPESPLGPAPSSSCPSAWQRLHTHALAKQLKGAHCSATHPSLPSLWLRSHISSFHIKEDYCWTVCLRRWVRPKRKVSLGSFVHQRCPGMSDTNFRISPTSNDVSVILHKPGICCSTGTWSVRSKGDWRSAGSGLPLAPGGRNC